MLSRFHFFRLSEDCLSRTRLPVSLPWKEAPIYSSSNILLEEYCEFRSAEKMEARMVAREAG